MQNIFNTLDENYIKFEAHIIHVIIDNDDKIWFNASEVALSLDYTYPKDAISNNVDKDDKIKLESINTSLKIKKHPHSIYINESGLYSLLLSSRLKKAKKFKRWITNEVLPSIRKYGYYKLKIEYEKKMDNIMNKINYLEKEKIKIEKDLKKNKFPNGGLVYIIDYSENNTEIYRLGKTGDMNNRKKIYDTHTLHKHTVVHFKETKCPLRLETCVRSMLYDYRYKDRKDFFICPLSKIKNAFKKCVESMECIDQNGGSMIGDKFAKLKAMNVKIKNKITILTDLINTQ